MNGGSFKPFATSAFNAFAPTGCQLFSDNHKKQKDPMSQQGNASKTALTLGPLVVRVVAGELEGRDHQSIRSDNPVP